MIMGSNKIYGRFSKKLVNAKYAMKNLCFVFIEHARIIEGYVAAELVSVGNLN